MIVQWNVYNVRSDVTEMHLTVRVLTLFVEELFLGLRQRFKALVMVVIVSMVMVHFSKVAITVVVGNRVIPRW